MPAAHPVGTATLLRNGKVLFTAGHHDGAFVNLNAELYDPALGIWSEVTTPERSHAEHTATLLPSGKVLVAGGTLNSGNDTLARTDLYDVGLGYAASSQPVVTTLTAPLQAGEKIGLTGTHLRAAAADLRVPPKGLRLTTRCPTAPARQRPRRLSLRPAHLAEPTKATCR